MAHAADIKSLRTLMEEVYELEAKLQGVRGVRLVLCCVVVDAGLRVLDEALTSRFVCWMAFAIEGGGGR